MGLNPPASQHSTLNTQLPLIPITERFLSDCGGWQALREGREIHRAGRVLEAAYAPPLLQGRVKTADSEVRAGLKILSKSNVENLCTCREARREGRICAHSLAVGMEIVKPRAAAAPPASVAKAPLEPVAPPIAALPAVAPDAFHLKLEGSLNYLAAEVAVRYGERTTTLDGRAVVGHARAEEAALERLRAAGFTGPDTRGLLVLKGEPRILAFFARELPRLEREWRVEIGARFEHVTRDVERIAPRLEIRSSGENWFELQFELGTAGGERFSSAEIQRLLQSGQTSVRLKNRKMAVFDPGLLEEFAEVLRDCEPQQRQPGLYRIDRRNAAYLIETASSQGLKVAGDPAWLQRAGGQGATLRPIPLGSLEEVLRPYQKHGVYWLNFLAMNGLAGILADEMGLGKTVQALAFLRTVRGRSLVVCPASLVFNWQREAARFAPELRVAAIVGPDRHARETDADLLITSYPLLRRDAERYRVEEFTAVILDEAQHIKNPDTQNAQAAYALRARHRFALTGTPLENSVRDLWSLLHFLMPGYLGSREDFRERYEREIQADPTGPAQRRLQRRLRPFVLRRLKRTVIAELPEKIEEVAYCELNEAQRELYAGLLQSARKQTEELASAGHQGQARMLVLTALLRLRQVCCDPALLGQESGEPAAKVELLEELLAEAIDGGHRVLVFSQFVKMLRILQERLRLSDTACCYLDGQTKDRAAQVDRFQTGEVPVFLISLKAGGTGLNLTAADTVIHFDPWWNPAVEAQATDRAHRIGQEKVVTSYKLIARGTVEEKILALQQRKRAILDASLESDQPLMEELSLEDIRELLE